MAIDADGGESAEGSAGNRTTKLNATDKEEANRGDRHTIVMKDDQLEALQFKSKEATPPFYNSTVSESFIDSLAKNHSIHGRMMVLP